MRPAGTSMSRIQNWPLGNLTCTLCIPGSRSNARYSAVVSPRGLPSMLRKRPPGVVRILMVPYFAFFDFAETFDAGAAKGQRQQSGKGKLKTEDESHCLIPPPASAASVSSSRNVVLNLRLPRPARIQTGTTYLARGLPGELESASVPKAAWELALALVNRSVGHNRRNGV